MPRVSKRKTKREDCKKNIRYYRTYLYLRLSEKDGGHGREDTIELQRQVCMDFTAKHPELVVEKTYADNGVTGTTFARPEMELLIADVRAGKVDCIIVKDFSRFGRDALEAVDLIDVVFPSLGVRFISILDEYDSENPACVQERVTNILKHFMNDYYAREVSAKLAQAHKASREKGEFWGARPPYGYERSVESTKKLVPEPMERQVVQDIFYWYVFEEMSSYDIAKELNEKKVPSPSESYEIRRYGETKKAGRRYWRADGVRKILQNPVYTGCAVYGKTQQKLNENLPLVLISREQWEIKEGVWEAVIEKVIFEKAQEILVEQWNAGLQIWAENPQKEHAADGPFLKRIYCGACGRSLARTNIGAKGRPYFRYYCPTAKEVNSKECCCGICSVSEKNVMAAVVTALCYQIGLAADFRKKYGEEFFIKLRKESSDEIGKKKDAYETYHLKLAQLFEHYSAGILDKEEYMDIKKTYLDEQKKAYQNFVDMKKKYQDILDRMEEKMEWANSLIKYRNMRKVNRKVTERFIRKITVNSESEIEVDFIFRDIFEESVGGEGGRSDVL